MKNILLSTSAIFIFTGISAQQINVSVPLKTKAVYTKCSGFAISKPLSDLPVVSTHGAILWDYAHIPCFV